MFSSLPLGLNAPHRALTRLTPIIGMFTILLAVFYLVLDAGTAISLVPWFGLIYGFVGAAPGLLLAVVTRNRRMLVVVALFLMLIAAAPSLDASPRKPFLRAANAITPGMTLSALDRQMSAYDRFPPEPGTLNPEGAVVYRYAFGQGDTDVVVVMLDGDRVVRRQILPD